MAAATAQATSLILEPYDYGEARRLVDELRISEPVAVTLVRRGYRSPEQARAFLQATEAHSPWHFDSMPAVVERILAAVRARRRITIHGDFDVDGVCATTIVVSTLRRLGADCDWQIPDRVGDGYGLSAAGVERLAARGTELLITVDCGIACAAEVELARGLGIEAIVTDHHAPCAELPDCPILHPVVSGYPFADLCGTGVAHKLSAALLAQSGRSEADADADLDLVALATVADMVALVGENRRLVRAGLAVIRSSLRPGMRALMAVSRTDPATVDETALGFRLAPRINAAGRLYRADAGVELMLTDDGERAAAIAAELDAANRERRDEEGRVLAAAERARAELPDRLAGAPALVLAGEGWHPGVIGIAASRMVDRHWRPVILISLAGERGRGSGRSIPGLDLVEALAACGERLLRFGGHSAAAGLELAADAVAGFRDSFVAHVERTLDPALLTRGERVDALVGAGGDGIGMRLAEELERLGPFGSGNPGPRLLMPSARVVDIKPMGEGASHARFEVESGSARARGVAFNVNGGLSEAEGKRADLAVRLELDRFNGAVAPRVVLRQIHPLPDHLVAEPAGGSPACGGCPPPGAATWWQRLEAVLDGPCAPPAGDGATADRARGGTCPDPALPRPGGAATRETIDRRGASAVAAIAELVTSGDSVLALCADASRRRALADGSADPRRFGGAPARVACCRCELAGIEWALAGQGPGGLVLLDWGALARAPQAADRFEHVVLVDPPPSTALRSLAARPRRAGEAVMPWAAGFLHLCWGAAELELALQLHSFEWELRPAVIEVYRALTEAGGGAEGEALAVVLAGASRHPRSPEVAGRVLRVMLECGLAAWTADRQRRALIVLSSEGTDLDRSEAYRAFGAVHEEGRRYLERQKPNP